MADERTDWKPLWRNREGVYSGQVIAKKDIPPYSRLIIRYNKFYDSNKPNSPRFVFCFASGDASKAITMEVSTEEYITLSDAEKLEEMRCFTDEQLQLLINIVACEAGSQGEYGMHIISDFVSGYGLETEVK